MSALPEPRVSLRDVMTPSPVVVEDQTAVGICARMLLLHGIRHLPVVDHDGHATGVLTDFDVFARGALVGPLENTWLCFEPCDQDLLAHDIASPADLILSPTTLVGVALEQLADARQDVALVCQQRVPIGIFTEHDGVRLARSALPPRPSAGQWCTQPPRSVFANDPATLALHEMHTHYIRHMLVQEHGVVVGVLSYRDMLAESRSEGPTCTAAEAVRRAPMTVTPTTPLRECARKMHRHHIGCLPVVDVNGCALGVITRTDLLRAVARFWPN